MKLSGKSIVNCKVYVEQQQGSKIVILCRCVGRDTWIISIGCQSQWFPRFWASSSLDVSLDLFYMMSSQRQVFGPLSGKSSIGNLLLDWFLTRLCIRNPWRCSRGRFQGLTLAHAYPHTCVDVFKADLSNNCWIFFKMAENLVPIVLIWAR